MAGLPASRVEVFDVTIPAGTAKLAPVEVATRFAAGELSNVEIVFPDGCNGLVGVQLAVGHNIALPTTSGAWLIGNDDKLDYDLVGMLNNGAWSVFGYNLDVYDHHVHVRYSVTDFSYLGQPVANVPAVLPPAS